jgi:hypothetical protein
MRTLTVLPAGMTFSTRRSLLSNSAAFAPLFVTTRTNGVLAFTLTSLGWNWPLSRVSGISGGASAAAAIPATMSMPATRPAIRSVSPRCICVLPYRI